MPSQFYQPAPCKAAPYCMSSVAVVQKTAEQRGAESLIYSNEKNEPHLFPYSRVVVHFIACYGYNVDRWSFPAKIAGLMVLTLLELYIGSLWIHFHTKRKIKMDQSSDLTQQNVIEL